MTGTKDIIITDTKSESDKLLSFLERIVYVLSLDIEGIAISTIATVVKDIIAKKIQDNNWNSRLEQYIRASDSASMSEADIKTLCEDVKEILNASEINIRKFILENNYLTKLSDELATNSTSNDPERLASVLYKVFDYLKDEIYRGFEVIKVIAEIVKENSDAIKKTDLKVDKLEERLNQCNKMLENTKNESKDLQEFISELKPLELDTNDNPFAYDSYKLQHVFGREKQIEKLVDFLNNNDKRFMFWVITGPGGVGKSKLAFHLGCMYHKEENWLVRELDQMAIQELCKQNNWNNEKNIFLIVDYANEKEQLKKLLWKLSNLNECENCHKIRLLLIAREGMVQSMCIYSKTEFPQWYANIVSDAHNVNDHLYFREFMDLTGLSIEGCIDLHKSFVENYMLREITEKEVTAVTQLIEQEILDDDGFVRPLYALFVIDSYYKTPKSHEWDVESLQKQIYTRDWNNWKSQICGKNNNHEKFFKSLTNLLLYTTVFGKWESGCTLPQPLSSDCETVFETMQGYATSDYLCNCFKLLTGNNCIINDKPVLMPLAPDMVGEYYVLRRLQTFDDCTLHSWAILMASNLVNCKDFFVRAIQDFGSHKSFVNIFLKIFYKISVEIDVINNEIAKTFAFLLETLYRKFKGNVDDNLFKSITDIIRHYVEENRNKCVYAAELSLIFHENRPHIGIRNRIAHFKKIESLYEEWPASIKIASVYIGFLGDIVAFIIGSDAAKSNDDYIEKFEMLLSLAESSDTNIKKAFISVLNKIIQRSISMSDWDRATHFMDDFLKKVMKDYDDELAMDFINEFDSVIISISKEKAYSLSDTKQENLSHLEITINNTLETAISFLKNIIDNMPNPSINFIWTYTSKLSMITKNLFINKCCPQNKIFFQYMLEKFQEIYDKYSLGDGNILLWHVSRVLDGFCDSKSNLIPPEIKAQCILKIGNIIDD